MDMYLTCVNLWICLCAPRDSTDSNKCIYPYMVFTQDAYILGMYVCTRLISCIKLYQMCTWVSCVDTDT